MILIVLTLETIMYLKYYTRSTRTTLNTYYRSILCTATNVQIHVVDASYSMYATFVYIHVTVTSNRLRDWQR